MRVVISGGSGRIGRFVVEEFASHGYEVTSLDLAPAATRVDGVRYMVGDVSRAEDVFGVLAYAKAEAMVHMAAWSDPGIVPDTRTYSNNVSATYNVLDAADNLGLKRVILASSAQVYGFADNDPLFAPVTEEHPLRPLNSYALSKVAGEEAAEWFSRRGLSTLSFRIMGARAPQDMATEVARARARPAQERFLLWTRIDARDVAIGCRQALETLNAPSGIYNLSGRTTCFEEETAALIARYAPATDRANFPPGNMSPFSSAKAHTAFGFHPQFPVLRTGVC